MSELPRKDDTILLVDDEPHNLRWVIEYLEDSGYSVDVATTMGAAIEMLQKNRFRTVVADLSIPTGPASIPRAEESPVFAKYPGLTVAEYARNRGHLGRQVIVYSVHDDDAVRAEANRLFCTYVMKGRPRKFKAELKDVLAFDPLGKR